MYDKTHLDDAAYNAKHLQPDRDSMHYERPFACTPSTNASLLPQDTNCTEGYTGRLCASCRPSPAGEPASVSYVPAGDGSCTQCSKYTDDLLGFFGWVLLLAIVLTVIGVTISWALKLRVIGDAVPRLVKSRGVQAAASLKILATALQVRRSWQPLGTAILGNVPRPPTLRPPQVAACVSCDPWHASTPPPGSELSTPRRGRSSPASTTRCPSASRPSTRATSTSRPPPRSSSSCRCLVMRTTPVACIAAARR